MNVENTKPIDVKNIQKISREIIGVRKNKGLRKILVVLACILKPNNFNDKIVKKKDWVT